MPRLPEEFVNRMRAQLGEEFHSFLASYDDPVWSGLRVNTLKVSVDELVARSPFPKDPVPWAQGGFYYDASDKPAKHPYYHAGLYYLQEPSAMAPGAIARATPGERILDMCAAPGGKSTQIAAGMAGQGILVANDIDADRVKALTKNLELFGVRNAIVTNETPHALALAFPEWFDKVLIDAPCSGEGMFRKDAGSGRSWQSFSCERCSGMQRDILAQAVRMVKVGGCIIYSTCTFAPEEDEQALDWFLDRFPGWELEDIPQSPGFSPGRPEWASGRPDLSRAVRLWPHLLRGEGHFVAALRRVEGSPVQVTEETDSPRRERAGRREPRRPEPATVLTEVPECATEFAARMFTDPGLAEMQMASTGRLIERRGNLYLRPEGCGGALANVLDGLNVVRPGWFIGLVRKGRFEPSTALATAIRPEMVNSSVDLPSSGQEVIRYLKCETLPSQGSKGWTLVSTDGFSLGWAKHCDGIMKNYYPSWWRWS